MSRDIYTEANEHFLKSGVGYEYGRPDMSMKNRSENGKTDSSRTEQDNDHDGLRGVDCSSFVWRGLKNAGYDVGNAPFGSHDLYTGKNTTPYAEKHFDVIGGAEAAKRHGNLQTGDILMLKSKHGSSQHVAIVKGYDADGNIQFIGSQTSTGPAEVTIAKGSFWDKDMEIVGALRAKPEFRTHEPLHGKGGAEPAAQSPVKSPSLPIHSHFGPAGFFNQVTGWLWHRSFAFLQPGTLSAGRASTNRRVGLPAWVAVAAMQRKCCVCSLAKGWLASPARRASRVAPSGLMVCPKNRSPLHPEIATL